MSYSGPKALSDIGDQLDAMAKELRDKRLACISQMIEAMMADGAGQPSYRFDAGPDTEVYVFSSGRSFSVRTEHASNEEGGYNIKTIAEELKPDFSRGVIYNLV